MITLTYTLAAIAGDLVAIRTGTLEASLGVDTLVLAYSTVLGTLIDI